MLKKMLLATSILVAPLSANADQLTVFETSSYASEIISQSEILGLSMNFAGGTSGGVVSAIRPNPYTFELAANNVHNTIPDALNIYALWQGVTSVSGLITINTQMATDEYAYGGWTISEVVYINGQGINVQSQVGLYPAPDQSFTFQVGNQPFDVQLQLQFVSNGAPPYGDFGSYVIATLADVPPHPVPGPIAGAGLPGLLGLLGMWWYRRQRDATRLISPR